MGASRCWHSAEVRTYQPVGAVLAEVEAAEVLVADSLADTLAEAAALAVLRLVGLVRKAQRGMRRVRGRGALVHRVQRTRSGILRRSPPPSFPCGGIG